VSTDRAAAETTGGTQMKFLTAHEVDGWCAAHGLMVSAERNPRYAPETLHRFTISLEDTPSRVIALADYLVPTWADTRFDGALLWIRQRGIWGDFSENMAANIVRRMRLADGETRPMQELPGHLFEAGELGEMHCYFVIPLMFGWDAFLLLEGQDYFIFVSHDAVVEVISRTRDVSEQVRQRVIDWKPTPAS
jgi:hypothetical protein